MRHLYRTKADLPNSAYEAWVGGATTICTKRKHTGIISAKSIDCRAREIPWLKQTMGSSSPVEPQRNPKKGTAWMRGQKLEQRERRLYRKKQIKEISFSNRTIGCKAASNGRHRIHGQHRQSKLRSRLRSAEPEYEVAQRSFCNT